MKVFISWSGIQSEKLAFLMKEYLKIFIQNLDPFMSSESIRKGSRWSIEIAKKLEEADFGIICLTKSNIYSPWLIFEAGALSKFIDKCKVCTLLFENLDSTDISGPLSQFQNTKFNRSDFYKLLKDILEMFKQKPIEESTLSTIFDKFWNELDEKVNKIYQESTEETNILPRTDTDLIKEILALTRTINKNTSRKGSISDFDYAVNLGSLNDEDLLTPNGNNYNHPIKVTIDPIEIEENGIKRLIRVIAEKGKVNIEQSTYPKYRRGVMIKITFMSEFENNLWELNFQFHKGNTLVSSENIKVDDFELVKYFEKTLWRD